MWDDYIENTKGHTWKLDEDGEVDDMSWGIGLCYGPTCIKCGYQFCVLCENGIARKDCEGKSE